MENCTAFCSSGGATVEIGAAGCAAARLVGAAKVGAQGGPQDNEFVAHWRTGLDQCDHIQVFVVSFHLGKGAETPPRAMYGALQESHEFGFPSEPNFNLDRFLTLHLFISLAELSSEDAKPGVGS